jgi:hypothetical protein
MSSPRWDRCIEHRGTEVDAFVKSRFGSQSRRLLLVAGAGFDPRSTALSERLASVKDQVTVVLIKEERPHSASDLGDRAGANLEKFRALHPMAAIRPVEIFGSDNAVVGGRNAIAALNGMSFDGVTDVAVDVSALSVGTSYPIIRYFFDRIGVPRSPSNVHVFVTADPSLDEAITPLAGDTVGFVHGFRGGWALDATSAAAKLWLPQLARRRNATLQRIYDFVSPHDTCPILPFPASRPRLADELVEEFLGELENMWQVDTRNLIHAAEDDPLDLYRTILRIDDLRRPVFQDGGGSLLILSPVGSKVLALGALMAALERDLPVAHLESIGYEMVDVPFQGVSGQLIHLWLAGEAYGAAA